MTRAVVSGVYMQVKVVRLYVGLFFTSVDMQGASITLLPADPHRLAALDSPTQASPTPTSQLLLKYCSSSMLQLETVVLAKGRHVLGLLTHP